MTLDDLKLLIDVQTLSRVPAAIAGLLVSPDVYAKIQAWDLPRVEKVLGVSWNVTVVKWLDPGTIIPVDQHGKPLPDPGVAGEKQ